MMMLSRNKPVAYVVGVAGFLGSHLAEKLLAKNIQVVGMDNLTTGRREYLEKCSKDKDFHFLNQSAVGEFDLDLPRVDYAFFILSEKTDESEYQKCLENFINLAKKFKPKIVYVSSLDLYDPHNEKYTTIKQAEKKLAQLTLENKLNTRVIRLSAVFGPRMHFREEDPICRLIQAASYNQIRKENTTLDFTTRALYVDDAVDLLIKAVMYGATAHKMYDGARLYPLKVMEIKQLLLNPLWYETRGFTPTQLPPWPTPNITKTQKELSWNKLTPLISSLKQTLLFFEQNPQCLNQIEAKETDKASPSPVVPEDITPLPEEKKQQLRELFKVGSEDKRGAADKKFRLGWPGGRNYLILALVLALLSYGLIYPLTLVAVTGLNVKNKLFQSYQLSKAGDYQQAQKEASGAQLAIGELKSNLAALKLFQTSGLFAPFIQSLSELTEILEKTIIGVQTQSNGQAALVEALRVISGGSEGNLAKLYQEADANFSLAEGSLGFVQGKLADPTFIISVSEPWTIFKESLGFNLKELGKKIGEGEISLQKGKVLVRVMPELIPAAGKKTYLILAKGGNGGGVTHSFAELNFEDGKLQKIITEPSGWSLKEVNTEADFSTIARELARLYQRQSGQTISGVILMDETVLPEVSKLVDGGVIKEDQAQPSILKEVLNKLFFSPKLDYNLLGTFLNKKLEGKHLAIIVSDTAVQGYLSSQGWTGTRSK